MNITNKFFLHSYVHTYLVIYKVCLGNLNYLNALPFLFSTIIFTTVLIGWLAPHMLKKNFISSKYCNLMRNLVKIRLIQCSTN